MEVAIMDGIAQKLAEYVVGLKYDDLPAPVIDMAKKCILDSLGNLYYGRYSDMGRRILDYIKDNSVSAPEEARVSLIGGGKVSKEDALMAHAVMARCADLDDGHRFAMGHPGSVIIPAVLSVGELKKRCGREVIAAVVAGYDVYCRIGAAINPTSYRERGFDATGIVGAVACAAAIGKLYQLDVQQMKNALGIAGLFAGGLIEYQNDGTMGKVLCGCWAIRNGMESVKLAEHGFSGTEKIFEGSKGFLQAYSNAPNSENVLADLGADYKITETYFKMHACMRGLHAAVDAVLNIRMREKLKISNIAKVEVHTTPFVGRLSKPRPETVIGAQCSLEFVLAVALKEGHVSSEEMLAEALKQEDVFELASKIHLCMDAKVEEYVKQNPSHWGAVNIMIYTNDGKRMEQWMALPQGEAETPFDWEDIEGKFKHLTAGTPFEACTSESVKRIRNFEALTNLEDLAIPENSATFGCRNKKHSCFS